MLSRLATRCIVIVLCYSDPVPRCLPDAHSEVLLEGVPLKLAAGWFAIA